MNHYSNIIHLNKDGRYLCNQKVAPHRLKLSENEDKVTCLNYKSRMKSKIVEEKTNRAYGRSPVTNEQIKMVRRLINNDY